MLRLSIWRRIMLLTTLPVSLIAWPLRDPPAVRHDDLRIFLGNERFHTRAPQEEVFSIRQGAKIFVIPRDIGGHDAQISRRVDNMAVNPDRRRFRSLGDRPEAELLNGVNREGDQRAGNQDTALYLKVFILRVGVILECNGIFQDRFLAARRLRTISREGTSALRKHIDFRNPFSVNDDWAIREKIIPLLKSGFMTPPSLITRQRGAARRPAAVPPSLQYDCRFPDNSWP